jgi:hypothetical protein
MPSWCLTISDVELPSVGFYRKMQRNIEQKISTHMMASRPRRDAAPCFFVYTGQRAYNQQYPHVTVMLQTPLFQKAGMLFFRSSEFHVSSRNDTKLFYVTGRTGQFVEDGGQGGLLGGNDLRVMGATFTNALRADITAGITPRALDDGWADLREARPGHLRPWEQEAAERQQLQHLENEHWARQFEWPDGY